MTKKDSTYEAPDLGVVDLATCEGILSISTPGSNLPYVDEEESEWEY